VIAPRSIGSISHSVATFPPLIARSLVTSPCELRFANTVKKCFTYWPPSGVKKTEPRPKSWSRLVTRCPPHEKSILASLRYYASAIQKVFSKPRFWRSRVERLLRPGPREYAIVCSASTHRQQKNTALTGTVPFVLTLIYRLARPSGLSEIGPRF
jgi:hypothetical protein